MPAEDSSHARSVLIAHIRQFTGAPWNNVTIELNEGEPLIYRTTSELFSQRSGTLFRLRDLDKRSNSICTPTVIYGKRTLLNRLDAPISLIEALLPTKNKTRLQRLNGTSQKSYPSISDIERQKKILAPTYILPGTYTLAKTNRDLTLELDQQQHDIAYYYDAQPLVSSIANLTARFLDSTIWTERFAYRMMRIYHGNHFLTSTRFNQPPLGKNLSIAIGPNREVTVRTRVAKGFPKSRWLRRDRKGISVCLNNHTDGPISLLLNKSAIGANDFRSWIYRFSVDGKRYRRIPSIAYELGIGEERVVEVRWVGK